MKFDILVNCCGVLLEFGLFCSVFFVKSSKWCCFYKKLSYKKLVRVVYISSFIYDSSEVLVWVI